VLKNDEGDSYFDLGNNKRVRPLFRFIAIRSALMFGRVDVQATVRKYRNNIQVDIREVRSLLVGYLDLDSTLIELEAPNRPTRRTAKMVYLERKESL